jgi:dynein heavy chain, axonemal
VLVDQFDEMLKFFISRVRTNLHLVLCFSPVGDAFRVRARRFPGLINCTSIDRFHAWPKEALISVATRFISELDLASDAIKQQVGLHMAEVRDHHGALVQRVERSVTRRLGPPLVSCRCTSP